MSGGRRHRDPNDRHSYRFAKKPRLELRLDSNEPNNFSRLNFYDLTAANVEERSPSPAFFDKTIPNRNEAGTPVNEEESKQEPPVPQQPDDAKIPSPGAAEPGSESRKVHSLWSFQDYFNRFENDLRRSSSAASHQTDPSPTRPDIADGDTTALAEVAAQLEVEKNTLFLRTLGDTKVISSGNDNDEDDIAENEMTQKSIEGKDSDDFWKARFATWRRSVALFNDPKDDAVDEPSQGNELPMNEEELEKVGTNGQTHCVDCGDDPFVRCSCSCQKCFGKTFSSSFICCSECNSKFHSFCVGEFETTSKTWVCPSCATSTKVNTLDEDGDAKPCAIVPTIPNQPEVKPVTPFLESPYNRGSEDVMEEKKDPPVTAAGTLGEDENGETTSLVSLCGRRVLCFSGMNEGSDDEQQQQQDGNETLTEGSEQEELKPVYSFNAGRTVRLALYHIRISPVLLLDATIYSSVWFLAVLGLFAMFLVGCFLWSFVYSMTSWGWNHWRSA